MTSDVYKKRVKQFLPTRLINRICQGIKIKKKINQLKDNIASGHDEIKTKIVQKLKDVLAPLITFLINKCMKVRIFSDILKIVKHKQLHDNLSAYHILNFFEKVLYSRFCKYFAATNGFLKKRNTHFCCQTD